jgi:hypothetical protein
MTSPVTFEITNYANTTLIDLSNGNPQLISGSFSQNMTELGESVQETFQTVTRGTTRSICRSAIANLERVLETATYFHKYASEHESIWIKAATENETKRRSLIISWSRKDLTEKLSDPLMDKAVIIVSQWTIERHAYWEALPADAYTKILTNLYHSGLNSYPEVANANDSGTAPARIASLTAPYTEFYEIVPPGFKRIWIGYHPKQDPTHWISRLYIGKENYWTGGFFGYRNIADSLCPIEGLRVTCNFAAQPAWKSRWSIRIPHNDALTPNALDEDKFVGEYLVLMRARVSDSTTVARVALGIEQVLNLEWWGTPKIPGDLFEEIYIDDVAATGDYHYYEMGVMQFPPEGYRQLRRNNDGGLHVNRITCVAERLAGTGELFCESLIFIPYTHFISLNNSFLNDGNLNILQHENDEIQAYLYSENTAGGATLGDLQRAEVTSNDWHIPPYTQGTWVALVEFEPEYKPLEQADYTLTIFPRYYTYNDD